MQPYDLIMVLVLVAAGIWGAFKGFAWQVASLASIVASYFVAYEFRQPLAQAIDATPPWNMFLAMLILYLGCSLAIWIGFRFVSDFIEKAKLKGFDRQIGAMLGFVKGAVLCVVITLFAITLLGDEHRRTIVQSKSGYYIAVLLDRSRPIMPQEVHDVLYPYIQTLDQPQPGNPSQAPYPAIPVNIPGGQQFNDRVRIRMRDEAFNQLQQGFNPQPQAPQGTSFR